MIEIIMDASQLELFQLCPRKWYYANVLNLQPRFRTKSALSIGSYYHEVLAHFYNSLKAKVDFTESLRRAADFAAQPTLLSQWHILDPAEQIFHRKRLIDYFYKWNCEDSGMEVIAVEQGFSRLLYEDAKRRYILEGKID